MQILQFFIEILEESGTTFEQNLLGSRAIGTIDPENVEAILSTNFDGNALPQGHLRRSTKLTQNVT